MHTTAQLTVTDLAEYVAVNPRLDLGSSPTAQDTATVIVEDLLTHRSPTDALAWDLGRAPEATLERHRRARQLVEQLGVDKLIAAIDDALLAVPCLTVRQPWADSITYLGKHTENRGRRINYRGLLMIHAAKEADRKLIQQVRRMDPELPLPRKALVGVARVTGCHPAQYTEQGDVCCRPWGEPGTDGNTVWHWELSNVHRLPSPVECPGAQSLWRMTPALLDAVLSSKKENA